MDDFENRQTALGLRVLSSSQPDFETLFPLGTQMAVATTGSDRWSSTGALLLLGMKHEGVSCHHLYSEIFLAHHIYRETWAAHCTEPHAQVAQSALLARYTNPSKHCEAAKPPSPACCAWVLLHLVHLCGSTRMEVVFRTSRLWQLKSLGMFA